MKHAQSIDTARVETFEDEEVQDTEKQSHFTNTRRI